MIAHLTKTSSFQRTATYLEVGDGNPAPNRVLWVEPYGGASARLPVAAAEMDDLAQYSGRVEVPGYHLILAFDPDDDVGKGEMLYVRDQVHEALGFQDLMSTVVSHGDAYYPHFHELICRVDYWNGKAVAPSFPFYTIETRLRELERTMGLRETPGRHGRLPDQKFQPKYDWRWLSREDRRFARAALRTSASWSELESRLALRGLTLRLDRESLILARGDDAVPAGKIQRGTSLMKMEHRMGETFPAHLRSERTPDRREPPKPEALRPESSAHHRSAGRAVAGHPETDHPETDHPEVGPRETWPGDGKVPSARVQQVIDQARSLARIDEETTASARRMRRTTRLELWEAELHELSQKTVEARSRMDGLMGRVFQDPLLASAHLQAIASLEGDSALRKILCDSPGRLGTPTPRGASREGELILDEIAEVVQEYFDLLESTHSLRRDMLAERIVDVPPECGRLEAFLGMERAREVEEVLSKPGTVTAWSSRELPEELLHEVASRSRMQSAVQGSIRSPSRRDIEVNLQRLVRELSPDERKSLQRFLDRDPSLSANKRVMRIANPDTAQVRRIMTR